MKTVSTVEARGRFNSQQPTSKHTRSDPDGGFQKAEGQDEHYLFKHHIISAYTKQPSALLCARVTRSGF